jgi:acyl-coenzyme A synthetase/AMP-(fatty) acid ligase
MQSPIDRLVHWAHTKPNALALQGAGIRTSYSALLRGVQARAAWLHHVGVRQGDAVALGLSNTPAEYSRQVELFYAIAYLGATVLPLYPEVTMDRRGPLADQFHVQWLLSEPLHYAGRARLVNVAQFDEQAIQWASSTPLRGDKPSMPFLYEFTSGTTGIPKTVCFSGEEYTARWLVTAQQFQWSSNDVMVSALRWPAKVGVRGLVRALILGATYANEPFPETRHDLARLVAQAGVTYIGSSPWQLRRLLGSPPLADWDQLPPFKMGTAGAHIGPHDIRAVRDTLTRNFHMSYGTTELGTMGYLGPEDAPESSLHPVPGMECQALDNDGQPLPVGELGRLRFRAPWIPKRYATGNTDPVEGFHGDWFVSSDWGAVDAQGHITLGGRADDAINCGGAKIQPQEVEQALAAHPDVADVAVVGVPDAMAGEIAVAFLVLRHPVPLDAMMVFLTPLLEPYQIPSAFAGLEEIPRNPEGKVLRSVLRDIYTATTGARHAPP